MYSSGFLMEQNTASGAYWVHCYDHDGSLEAYVTVAFGPFSDDEALDREPPTTFAARFGSVVGQDHPAFSVVDAREHTPDSRSHGCRLDRPEALAHPLIDTFWNACDVLTDELLDDPRHWPGRRRGMVDRIREHRHHRAHRRR